MKTLRVIGGNFSDIVQERSTSSVVTKLHIELTTILIKRYGMIGSYSTNGGFIRRLKKESRDATTDITVWMPNVSNKVEKIYPTKPKGGILICSKVLRQHRTIYDAVGRIFKMHGNAVIAIDKSGTSFRFILLDALGNVWVDTHMISRLVIGIYKFYEWSQKTERIGSSFSLLNDKLSKSTKKNLEHFCKLNTLVANKVENGNTNRYFGNCSTRCSLMFPSHRCGPSNKILVSKRNSNKERLEPSDMLITNMDDAEKWVLYQGSKDIKPSVDTPIQLQLYKQFPHINYMIHGHAYIDGAPWSDNYYACGDLREVNSVALHINRTSAGAVNLRNHGFLIYAKTITEMRALVNQSVFKNKIVGEDFI